MSLIPFFKNFTVAKGNQAAVGLAKALVQLDPDAATRADLATMEQDLDKAGIVIAKLRSDLAQEQKEFEVVRKQYTQMMGAAEILKGKLDATMDAAQKVSLNGSLESLLARIEHLAPELDAEKHDAEQTQSLLTDAEAAYQEKAIALTQAKQNLDRARHDLQHAKIQEERSDQRAEQAAVVAGLKQSPSSNLTTALNVMQQSADEARQRASASDMKASALAGATQAATDPNIAEAMSEVNGSVSPASLGDRLEALRRKAA